MLAFELFVDDRRICLAGMEDWAVMSVILSAVRHRDRDPADQGHVDVSVGGLAEADAEGVSHHARWARIDLEVGTRVMVKLVDTDAPDPPVKRYRSDHKGRESFFTEEEIEAMEREEWLRLKAKFEPGNGKMP